MFILIIPKLDVTFSLIFNFIVRVFIFKTLCCSTRTAISIVKLVYLWNIAAWISISSFIDFMFWSHHWRGISSMVIVCFANGVIVAYLTFNFAFVWRRRINSYYIFSLGHSLQNWNAVCNFIFRLNQRVSTWKILWIISNVLVINLFINLKQIFRLH